jgi:hypothetical protein
MTTKNLSDYFGVNRRYARSINLERDFELPNAVLGYVLTERAVDSLNRVFEAIAQPGTKAASQRSSSTRAWTFTGVYGTGKSAFAHYLTSLCAPSNDPMRHYALDIAKKAFGKSNAQYRKLESALPEKGLFRAVAVGQREPLCNTVIRALYRGAEVFWSSGRKPEVVKQLTAWVAEMETSSPLELTNAQVIATVKAVAEAAKTDVLLIIDELGKNLEFAAHTPGGDDLYLLQQLAELPRGKNYQVYTIGLLHQAFAEYSQRLASTEKNEWAKIQGRFEDIPFAESTEQMTRLIGQAIDHSKADSYKFIVSTQADEWSEKLKSETDLPSVSADVLADAYPLHPVTSIALPTLCMKYAQNDRSLFTFLTSSEPHSFARFLEQETVQGDDIPTLKLHQVYDYFVESVGSGMGSRPNLQRWIEIQGLVSDARHLDDDSQIVLKTIGILNLITATGAFRATRTLVKFALMGRVGEKKAEKHWDKLIQGLCDKGLITYRKQLDELRVWEGSDFDVDRELVSYVDSDRTPLAQLLTSISPLKPVIAQRHSYQKGTLRYFERQYLGSEADFANLCCTESSCDGLVGYWLDKEEPIKVPSKTRDGKPFILLTASSLNILKIRAQEFAGLKKIQLTATQLQSDGVARREVRHRLVQAKRLLDEILSQTFNVSSAKTLCWIQGKQVDVCHGTEFNARLSDVCDRVYNQTPTLWNELINRRELTSQGAKARRQLIEAILDNSTQENLGLEGYGPEVSMYRSVLTETGMHRLVDGEWTFHEPHKKAGILSVWEAIETFCLGATEGIQTLEHLYGVLEAPPYGVKRGVIPVVLAVFLCHHFDDVSIYKDGTFIPILSSEHFELLVKDPSRYGVKHIAVAGLRAKVFQELESVLRVGASVTLPKVRNTTLLSVVKPLFQFARRLPAYTLKTKRMGKHAQAVLETLRDAQEPDELVFKSLPVACGMKPIEPAQADDGSTAKRLRKELVLALQEIQNAYEKLLSECKSLLHLAFGVREEEKLREDLRVRSRQLVDQCIDPLLRRFTLAAVDESMSDREWTEALVMIVADRPAESWSDDDVNGFEIKLSDLARKFKNLEALRSEVAVSKHGGFDARRVTITRADGQEIHRMVWLDHQQKKRLEESVDEMARQLAGSYEDAQIQQVLVALLAERILGVEYQGESAKLQSKVKGRQNVKETNQARLRSVGRKG